MAVGMGSNTATRYLVDFIYKTSGIEKVTLSQKQAEETARAATTMIKSQGFGLDIASVKTAELTNRIDKNGKAFQDWKIQATDSKKRLQEVAYTTQKVNGETQIVENTFKRTMKTSKEYTKSLMQQSAGYAKLALRAIAVVPIWMLIRGAYSEVIAVFTQGLKTMREMDEAMLKAEAVIHNSTMSIGDSIEMLETQVRSLAITTGSSMAELSSAFYRFGTVGLSFEASMGGMEAANRTAIAMMGKTDEIAKVLSRTYRLLGDSMDKNLPVSEQMDMMGAKLYTLWQDNAFEIDGMTQSLMQFLPVANQANMSYNETISLLGALNTASVINSKAGRLLRTSLLKQSQNYGEIGKALGIYVNPQMESQYKILVKIIAKIAELNKSGKDLTQVNDALSKIYGGVRGQQPIQALAGVFDTLQSNMERLGSDGGDMLDEFGNRVDKVTAGLNKQLEITGQLKKQIQEAFLIGLFGGDDFTQTITNMNRSLKEGIVLAEKFGASFVWIKNIGSLGMAPLMDSMAKDIITIVNDANRIESEKSNQAIADIRAGRDSRGIVNRALGVTIGIPTAIEDNQALNQAGTMNVFNKVLENRSKGISKELFSLENRIKEAINPTKKTGVAKIIEDINRPKGRVGRAEVSEDTLDKLTGLDNELKYLELTYQGYSKEEVLQQKLLDIVNLKVDSENKLREVSGYGLEVLTAKEVMELASIGNYEEILNQLVTSKDGEKDILEIKKAMLAIDKDRTAEAIKLSASLQGVFQGSLEDLFSGKESDFLGNFSEGLRKILTKQLSGAITEAFFKASGIGQVFATSAMKIESAIKRGANYHAAKIVSAQTGQKMSGFATGGATSGGGFLNTPLWGGGTGTGGAIVPRGAGTTSQGIKVPGTYGAVGSKAGPTLGGLGGSSLLAAGAGSSFYQAAGGGALGIGAGVAGGLGALGLAAGAGTLGAGVAGVGAAGGALGGMLGVVGTANAWNPVGWALLAAAAVMAIIGMNKGKPEWTKEDTQEQTKAIGSRIDVTNKQLEWVNRNLVALRQEITYILPDSAYFAERAPEDRFAIDAQRGALT